LLLIAAGIAGSAALPAALADNPRPEPACLGTAFVDAADDQVVTAPGTSASIGPGPQNTDVRAGFFTVDGGGAVTAAIRVTKLDRALASAAPYARSATEYAAGVAGAAHGTADDAPNDHSGAMTTLAPCPPTATAATASPPASGQGAGKLALTVRPGRVSARAVARRGRLALSVTARRPATAVRLRLRPGVVPIGPVVASAHVPALRGTTRIDLRPRARLRPGDYVLEVSGRDEMGRAASSAFRITVRK
jgi:hypothetical protein